MTRYTLVTRWTLRAPIEAVWDALITPRDWPRWWRYVARVEELEKGDATGLGSLNRYTWTSRLPYRLSFATRTTLVEKPFRIEGEARGDLNGRGAWRLDRAGEATAVQYTWSVDTDKAWMNVLAPLLAPVFAWNHDQVMLEGGRGLARHLETTLVSASGSHGKRLH